MIWKTSKEPKQIVKGRKNTEGVRILRRNSAEKAKNAFESQGVEQRLRTRQRSADRADAWSAAISK